MTTMHSYDYMILFFRFQVKYKVLYQTYNRNMSKINGNTELCFEKISIVMLNENSIRANFVGFFAFSRYACKSLS